MKRWWILVLIGVSCRDIEPELEPQQTYTIFPSQKPNVGIEEIPQVGQFDTTLGKIDPNIFITDDKTPSTYDVLIEPYDSLELFAKWTKKSKEELLRHNPSFQRKGLIPGEIFHLVLTPAEAAAFNGARTAYIAKMKAASQSPYQIEKIVRHTVSKGETIQDILKRYPTTIELIEKYNPRLGIIGLREKQIIQVPIVSNKDTKFPKPSPIPEPPPPPKPKICNPPQKSADRSDCYIVQPGDTAWIIARKKLNTTLEKLRSANPDIDFSTLQVGRCLKKPK